MVGPSPWTLTTLGCPDCSGVLTVRQESGRGLLIFRCSVGHTFSDESLIAAKEEQLEAALWTVVELFRSIALICDELAAHARADDRAAQAAAHALRGERAQEHEARVRQIIATDGPAALRGPG